MIPNAFELGYLNAGGNFCQSPGFPEAEKKNILTGDSPETLTISENRIYLTVYR
jgi:hypothetical protein